MTEPVDSRPASDAAIEPAIDAARATPSSGRWRVEVVPEAGSTNAEVAERFRAGEGEGLVLVAEHQTHGRGRLGREWVTPARSSLTASFLVVPESVAPARWPWLPLVTGVAAARAVRRVAAVEAELKWPNDVLVDGLKVGGILLERVDRPDGTAAAVIGVGLNCSQAAEELPFPETTSLGLASGGTVDRTALLAALVEELAACLHRWAAGEDLRPDYLELCTTLGREVRVAVPGGEVVGTAADVDGAGRLVVRTETGEDHLGAGDVLHVRPGQPPE